MTDETQMKQIWHSILRLCQLVEQLIENKLEHNEKLIERANEALHALSSFAEQLEHLPQSVEDRSLLEEWDFQGVASALIERQKQWHKTLVEIKLVIGDLKISIEDILK